MQKVEESIVLSQSNCEVPCGPQNTVKICDKIVCSTRFFVISKFKIGLQIQTLRTDYFLQLFPGFNFGFDVKAFKCQLTCLKCVHTCTIKVLFSLVK